VDTDLIIRGKKSLTLREVRVAPWNTDLVQINYPQLLEQGFVPRRSSY